MTVLRSALFWLALLIFTPPYALLAIASAPLPRMARYRVISGWSRLMRQSCGTCAASAGASKGGRTCHSSRR